MIDNGRPAWLPDWREETQYPDPKSTSKLQWGWEFVRRNVQYQNDCKDLNTWKKSDKVKSLDETSYIFWQRLARFNTKWGVYLQIHDPSVNRPDFSETWSYSTDIFTFEDSQFPERIPGVIPQGWNRATISFDLGSSIDRQVKDAKKLLKRTQKHFVSEGKIKAWKGVRHPSGKVLQTYLRCHDAHVLQISKEVIAKEIFPDKCNSYPTFNGSQSVSDSIKAAHNYINQKYRYLL